MMKDSRSDRAGKCLFFCAAVLCVLAILAIFAFLIWESLPFFKKVGLTDFLFGKVWSPDRYDTYLDPVRGSYGIFPMLIGSLVAGGSALLLGGGLGILFAIFLVFYCPKRLREACNTLVLLLSGIPSVVYGFFGISFLLPKLSRWAPTNGSGLLATTLILGIMILPTVVALFRTALEAVPANVYSGAISLGAPHAQAVFCACVPAAKRGMIRALTLGFGRAIGETMAVILVAGNAPTYPSGLFRSFRVLTANIAMEMGYAGELQQGALVATGCILLLLILTVNLTLGHHARVPITKKPKAVLRMLPQIKSFSFSAKAIGAQLLLMLFSVAFVSLTLVILPAYLLVNGLPAWLSSKDLLLGGFSFGGQSVTLLPSLIATLMTVVLCLLIALPIGILSAVYLHEYANKKGFALRLIQGAIDLLNGVPSIVYGLFGMVAFVPILGGGSSILAGSLTVSILLLPTVTRATEESLSSIESGQREGSLALGATKTRTVWRIVLPAALPGILSAILLSIGRVMSESAPFLYTMGSVLTAIPTNYLDSGTTLASALYSLAGEGWHIQEAYACAVILLILVLLFNLAARAIAKRLSKRQL